MKNTSVAMLFLAMITTACSSQTHLTLIETTDTHGAFQEFANDASVLRQMKQELGDQLILLDNGDDLQGTPYQYCSNRDADHPNLVSAFLNFFPYDVVGVGNHDIEAGRPVFDRVYSELVQLFKERIFIEGSLLKRFFQFGTEGRVNLNWGKIGDGQIRIISPDGKELKSIAFSQTESINLITDGLPKGCCTVMRLDKDGQVMNVEKLIIK